MTALPPYTIGTVTLEHGSAAIEGNDTGWLFNGVRGGVMTVEVAGGNPLVIASVEDDEAATAATKWMGPSGTFSYAISLASAQAAETVWATRQWSRVIGDALLAAIQPKASGTAAERDALNPPLATGDWFALAEPGQDLRFQLKVASGWRTFEVRGPGGADASATSLANLSDVTLVEPANGQVLRYQDGQWREAALDKAAVGLGNVDNTSDANKPVSTAQAAAIQQAVYAAVAAGRWLVAGPDGALPVQQSEWIAGAGWIDGRPYLSVPEYLAAAGGTFVRGSDATWFDRDGILRTAAPHVLRLDHDPRTGKPLGLLMEGSQTNLVWPSSDLTHTRWTKVEATVLANQYIAPDGTLSAAALIDNGNAGFHNATTAVTGADTTVTFSAWFRADELQHAVIIGVGNALRAIQEFNLVTDAPARTLTQNTQIVAAGVVKGDGPWCLCWVIATSLTQAFHSMRLATSDGAGALGSDGVNYAGTGQRLAAWGVSVTAGSIPGSTIPTVSGTAIRFADNLSFAQTAAGEGTVLIKARTARGSGAGQVLMQLDAGNNANRYLVTRNSNGILTAYVTVAGSNVVSLNFGAVPNDADITIALSWRAGLVAASLNGGAALTNAYTGPLPAISRIYEGGINGASALFGTIARTVRWDRAYSPAQLQEMSA